MRVEVEGCIYYLANSKKNKNTTLNDPVFSLLFLQIQIIILFLGLSEALQRGGFGFFSQIRYESVG